MDRFENRTLFNESFQVSCHLILSLAPRVKDSSRNDTTFVIIFIFDPATQMNVILGEIGFRG